MNQPCFFTINALARERQPKADDQEPPAKRVRLKLKQKNILSDIVVSVQATKQKQKGCSLGQTV